MKTKNLTLVGTYGSGEGTVTIHRDRDGNLFETNNAVTREKLSWSSNLHPSSDGAKRQARLIYRECRKMGMGRKLAANYLSQCGYYDSLPSNLVDLVDGYNAKYGR